MCSTASKTRVLSIYYLYSLGMILDAFKTCVCVEIFGDASIKGYHKFENNSFPGLEQKSL